MENTIKNAQTFFKKTRLEQRYVHNKELSDLSSAYVAEVMVLYVEELKKEKSHKDILPK